MFILAGLVLMAFGLSKVYFKDLWWFDAMVLQRAFGRVAERTEQWDRSQDRIGLFITVCGVSLLLYNAFIIAL